MIQPMSQAGRLPHQSNSKQGDLPLNGIRMLQIYHRVPHPPRDGGVKAVLHHARTLVSLGAEVKWYCLNPSRNAVDLRQVPSLLTESFGMVTRPLSSEASFWAALQNLGSEIPYHLQRFWNRGAASDLLNLCAAWNPHLVLLEGLPMAIYMDLFRSSEVGDSSNSIPGGRSGGRIPVVYRSHNIEHEIIRQKAEQQPLASPLGLWLRWEHWRMLRFEKSVLREADAVLAISPEDMPFVQKTAPQTRLMHWGYWSSENIKEGRDAGDVSPEPVDRDRLRKLCFIGTLDWGPNQDAVRWFLESWLPELIRTEPKAVFHLAGRKAHHSFKSYLQVREQRHKGAFRFYGEVEDASVFMHQCGIFVVPMRWGGGLKVKAVEAIQAGLVLIATPEGVRGLNLRPGEDYLQASNPHEFRMALHAVFSNPALAEAMTHSARTRLQEVMDPSAQKEDLVRLIQELL